jgi:hypothetical protein
MFGFSVIRFVTLVCHLRFVTFNPSVCDRRRVPVEGPISRLSEVRFVSGYRLRYRQPSQFKCRALNPEHGCPSDPFSLSIPPCYDP